MTLVSGLFATVFRHLLGRRKGAVVRAAILGGLSLFARQVGRWQDGLNRLASVAALMTLEGTVEVFLPLRYNFLRKLLLQRIGIMNAETRLITSNPNVMMGKPVIAGTRITVELILEKLAAGETYEQILEAHPRLSREGIQAALAFAAEALRADVLYPISESTR